MELKYKGKTIQVTDDFIMQCGQHAASRGLTLEEYIIEAFTQIEKDKTNIFDSGQETLAGLGRPDSENDRQT